MSRSSHLRTQDGTQISFSMEGQGPYLILSNSLATNREMWRPQLSQLQAQFTVLSYDTRGHGESSVSDQNFGFDTLAADVIALMDHLKIDKTKFMGLSLGGMTGLALAIYHPDRMERVICCDARADAPAPYVAMWDKNIAASKEGGMEAVAEGTLPRWFSAEFRSDPANSALLSSIREMILSTPPEGYRNAARCLQTLDLLCSLDQIKIPVQFIVGEQDPAAPLPVVQDMAERIAGAQVHVVPKAAHLSNLENPQVFLSTAMAQLA